MTHRSRGSDDLAFARGILVFCWVALPFLGGLAGMLTWYGDCFAESCPQPTDLDRAIYAIDLVGWLVLGLVTAISLRRMHMVGVLVVWSLGVLYVAQAAAGLAGARGFAGFWILLPVGLLLLVAAAAGWLVVRGRPSSWARGSASGGVALGCAAYPAAWLIFFTTQALASGHLLALLLAASILATVLAIVRLRATRPR